MACPVSAAFSSTPASNAVHAIHLLNNRAAQLSGISFDEACRIEDVNISRKIGEYEMMQLSERFVARVRQDQDTWFSSLFSGREDFAQDQSDYLLQRFGGPSYYSDRKGPGQLIARHSTFEMSPRTAERWLEHMDAALQDGEDISANQRSLMMNYFRFTAYFFVAAQEASSQMNITSHRTADNPPHPIEVPTYARIGIDENVKHGPDFEEEGEDEDDDDDDDDV